MWALLVGCAFLGALVLATLIAYRGDLRSAIRLASTGSALASTPCGPIEYAVRGEGPPVLVVHGAGGGFDQGLLFGEDIAARGYRVIAMSRFGYLRTPMPKNASAQAQADAHACLLDALRVPRAAVIGVSAGGPSAMQFAIRHPQRTAALALLVPLAWYPASEPPSPPAAGMGLALRALEHDFAYWALTQGAPELVTRTLLATPPRVLEDASVSERVRIGHLLERILPVSMRAAGLRADGMVGATIQPYSLERITAPTLVISLEDDLFGTYPRAQYTAAQIPGARFVGFASGGHTWVGHHEEVVAAITKFLSDSRLAAR
jgi:2-hydroxy-6-oxonona-2,4-dienedioate hydrolase